MPDGLQGKRGGRDTPWARGTAALLVRAEADVPLRDTLIAWAGEREKAVGTKVTWEPDLFEHDARSLLKVPAVRAAVTDICQHHPNVTEAAVEAAVISLYVEVLWKHFSTLPGLYVFSVAARLRNILRLPLETVKLNAQEMDDEEEIAVSLAVFFFDSLRACKADPNCFRAQEPGERRLAVRPFGWSPVRDPFDTLLSLLILRQAGRTFRPKAFIGSPFAYYLRYSGLATVVDGQQMICRDCGKEYHQRSLGGVCPECGGRIEFRISKKLLATRRVEETSREAAAGETSLPPGQEGLGRPAAELSARQRELDRARERGGEMDGARRVFFEHALELWHSAAKRRPPSPTELAVLLALAGLEEVSNAVALRLPRRSWISRVVTNLLEPNLPREPVLRWAQAHMTEVCRAFGIEKTFKLTDGNVGKIIFRFRRQVIREE